MTYIDYKLVKSSIYQVILKDSSIRSLVGQVNKDKSAIS